MTDRFEQLLRFHFSEVLRLRLNIMSAGYVMQGVGVTRALLHQLAKAAHKRGQILSVGMPGLARGVVGFAHDLVVEEDDLWATVAIGRPAPNFERAAAVICPSGVGGWMIVGVMLTSLSRADITRLNQAKPE